MSSAQALDRTTYGTHGIGTGEESGLSRIIVFLDTVIESARLSS